MTRVTVYAIIWIVVHVSGRQQKRKSIMFSLVLASIYVLCQFVFNDVDCIVSIDETLPYLLFWHISIFSLKIVFWTLFVLIGLISSVTTRSDDWKIDAIVICVCSLFGFIVYSVTSISFITGVNLIDKAIQNGVVVDLMYLFCVNLFSMMLIV